MRTFVDVLTLGLAADPASYDAAITVGATALGVLAVLLSVRFLLGRADKASAKSFRNQGLMLLLTLVGVLFVILSVPDTEGRREQLLTLFGVVTSAAIALASTSFLGNALAGIQLRVVGAFKTGDFLRVEDHFGRVTERGLFHTEIQTEDRDLTTLPNLFLVSNAYKVVRASGTIISCTVSLGYDVSRQDIEECLKAAAAETGLVEPFVQVLELGDYSVTYRVAGMLTEVKQILTTRSKLRKRVIDALHGAGIEIVSPTFMNTRRFSADAQVVPEPLVDAAHETAHEPGPETEADSGPETMMFDKAEDAASLEQGRQELIEVSAALVEAETRLRAAKPDEKTAVVQEVYELTERRDSIEMNLGAIEARLLEDKEPGSSPSS